MYQAQISHLKTPCYDRVRVKSQGASHIVLLRLDVEALCACGHQVQMHMTYRTSCRGQVISPEGPQFMPSKALDFELEVVCSSRCMFVPVFRILPNQCCPSAG